MNWEWETSVRVQGKALRWIVMVLFAMAGLVSGAVVETLPRRVHLAILHSLRPAEAAARRLIIMVTRIGTTGPHDLAWKISDPRARRSAVPSRVGIAHGEEYVPAFRLFDPRKDVEPRRRSARGYGPRIWAFDGMDEPVFVKQVIGPDDPVPARHICLRLLSLKAALDDLPGQAARLMRMLSRVKRKWPDPLRKGRPPGHREGGKEQIDILLAECQTMALWALHEPRPG